MKTIYYASQADDASSFYRIQGVLPFINHPDLKLIDVSHLNTASWAYLLQCDTIIFQRFFNEGHVGVIKQAQQLGVKVVVDYDDDMLNIPEHNPAYPMYHPNRKYAMQCIRMADEVWVSTQAIADSFAPYNKNIHVIPNAHNDYLFPESRRKKFNPGNKLVMYRGANTHYLDLYEYTDQLVKVAHDNPSWNFTYMGQMGNEQFFRANKDNQNVSFTNSVPFPQYIEHIGQKNPMVAICPLEGHLLNKAKSNCSFLEMTYAGAAFFGNTDLPEFDLECILPLSGLNITLKDNLLTRLRTANENSWEYIKENLFLSKVNGLREERLLV